MKARFEVLPAFVIPAPPRWWNLRAWWRRRTYERMVRALAVVGAPRETLRLLPKVAPPAACAANEIGQCLHAGCPMINNKTPGRVCPLGEP